MTTLKLEINEICGAYVTHLNINDYACLRIGNTSSYMPKLKLKLVHDILYLQVLLVGLCWQLARSWMVYEVGY